MAECWWCWKTQAEVARLFESHRGAYICDECVELCYEIGQGKWKPERKEEARKLVQMRPRDDGFFAKVKEFFEGQR